MSSQSPCLWLALEHKPGSKVSWATRACVSEEASSPPWAMAVRSHPALTTPVLARLCETKGLRNRRGALVTRAKSPLNFTGVECDPTLRMLLVQQQPMGVSRGRVGVRGTNCCSPHAHKTRGPAAPLLETFNLTLQSHDAPGAVVLARL